LRKKLHTFSISIRNIIKQISPFPTKNLKNKPYIISIMQMELDLNKSVEQNAEVYFEKAKKARRKIDGINKAIASAREKLERLHHEEKERLVKKEEQKKAVEKKKARKQEWYEKFRWFFSSEGFLVVGGRDATTNEIMIKKHAEKDDLVFHTDMAGSPFFIVKANSQPGKKPTEKTLQEVADTTCAYSRAWKLGMSTTEVFWVNPDQVSKTAQPGEFLPKGAFMIRGKTNYVKPRLNIAIGMLDDGRVMGASVNAVKAHCKKYVEISQGNEKTSETAKKIRAKIGGDLDDIIKVIPSGGAKVRK